LLEIYFAATPPVCEAQPLDMLIIIFRWGKAATAQQTAEPFLSFNIPKFALRGSKVDKTLRLFYLKQPPGVVKSSS
jgi:hypothetical protein